MAHFNLSLPAFRRLPVRSHGATRVPPRPHHATVADARRGPGWFDSSWDLHSGLEVREGLPEDAKLVEWIDVCLRS